MILYSLELTFLLLSGAIVIGAIVWHCRKTKKSPVKFIVCALLALPLVVFLLLAMPIILFLASEIIPEQLDRFFPIGGKHEIIELDKFETFSGKRGNEYYYTVLVKGQPEDADSMKRLMARYFIQKSQYIDSIDSGSYLGSAWFHRYTRESSYFIEHDESRNGSIGNKAFNPAPYLGSIRRAPCHDDSSKYRDIMYVSPDYVGGGYENKDTIYCKCKDYYIDNWYKYGHRHFRD